MRRKPRIGSAQTTSHHAFLFAARSISLERFWPPTHKGRTLHQHPARQLAQKTPLRLLAFGAFFNPVFDLALGPRANHGCGYLAVFEEHKRWDTANAVLVRRSWVLIDV